MYHTMRDMQSVDIIRGKAVPRGHRHPVWRCPACGRETPREVDPA